ncbi:MAG: hypothetical protein ACOZF2_01390 [Thermodesulfobacteriota bacterium]
MTEIVFWIIMKLIRNNLILDKIQLIIFDAINHPILIIPPLSLDEVQKSLDEKSFAGATDKMVLAPLVPKLQV